MPYSAREMLLQKKSNVLAMSVLDYQDMFDDDVRGGTSTGTSNWTSHQKMIDDSSPSHPSRGVWAGCAVC
eukprot:scaffold52948_cov58-Attheya_sp.AAC.2